MAKVANPKKVFQFGLSINGVNQFLIQDCKIPTAEIAADTHGDTNHDIKTAGRVTIGDIELKKLIADPTGDNWAMDWLNEAQNHITGGGTVPQLYKRNVIIAQYAEDGLNIVNRWVCNGVWCKKVEMETFKRGETGNIIENVMLSVDSIQKL